MQPVLKNSILPMIIYMSASGALSQEEQKTITLTGHIEHAEKLPPVPAQLQPGVVYEQKRANEAETFDEWYRVPNCMAGTWETFERLDENGLNLMDGSRLPTQVTSAHTVLEKGRQIDAHGEIWDCQITGATRQTNLPGRTRNITSKSFKLLESNPESILTETRSTQVDVSTDSGKIIQVLQVESITRMKCSGARALSATASVKTFNKSGVPTFITQQKAQYRLIKAFSPVNQVNGKDLNASFVNYLRAKGMPDLIPNNNVEPKQNIPPGNEDRSTRPNDVNNF